MIPRYARLGGGTVVPVPWPTGRPWPREEVLRSLSPDTGVVAVVSPNNPTGDVATAADLRAVAAAAPHCLVVVDHAYVEYADEDLTSVAAGLPNVAVVRTFSKAWGLAGLRVGYVLAPPAIVAALRAAGGPYSVAGPSAALARERLARDGASLAAHVARVRRERTDLAALLRRLGAEAGASQANFVLARCGDAAFLRDGLAGLGIAVRHFPDRPELAGCLRITCPGAPDAFTRLQSALETVLAPQALLLDLDGVVADVSGSYREAIRATAASFGVEADAPAVAAAKQEGDANNDWVVTQRLLARAGLEVDLATVTARFETLYQGGPAAPGLRERERPLIHADRLRQVAGGRPVGLVTGRPRRDCERFLADHGLSGCFDAVVCMEDAPAKPDPAPVRAALERLGVERAWMVGDTVDDARAARAAGVLPLGVLAPGDGPERAAERLLRAGCARVLDSLDRIEELLP
jgi:HAD superfamily hydrolase (TIGR01548 family)